MAAKIIIHRDHSFEFNGDRFKVLFGGPGWGWEVHADNEFASGTDIETHLTLRELREELDYRADNGIPIRILLPGDRQHLDGTVWRDGEFLESEQ